MNTRKRLLLIVTVVALLLSAALPVLAQDATIEEPRPEAAAVTVGGRTLVDVPRVSIGEALQWVEGLRPHGDSGDPHTLTTEQAIIADPTLIDRITQRYNMRMGR